MNDIKSCETMNRNYIALDELTNNSAYPIWNNGKLDCTPHYVKFYILKNMFIDNTYMLEASLYTKYKIRRAKKNKIQVYKCIWTMHIGPKWNWDDLNEFQRNKEAENFLFFCKHPKSLENYKNELEFSEEFITLNYENVDDLKNEIPIFNWKEIK